MYCPITINSSWKTPSEILVEIDFLCSSDYVTFQWSTNTRFYILFYFDTSDTENDRLRFSGTSLSLTWRVLIPLSASRLSGMTTAALCSNNLPGVVLKKEEEFLLNWHGNFKVVDKSFWIRFVVISHRDPPLKETVRFRNCRCRLL